MIGILLALLITMFVLWQAALKNTEEPVPQTQQTEQSREPVVETSALQIQVPLHEEPVCLVSSAVNAYMSADLSKELKPVLMPYREEFGRLDIGLPVNISYELYGLPRTITVASAVLEVSENRDFSDSRVYALRGEERSVNVYHLKTDTQYYYRINVTLSDNTVTVVQRSFRTADTPRILSIDGAVNVRDIGGWETTDGKVIRQGLLYRGSELDGAIEPEYKLTSAGLETMLTVLGIRTDMDLRASANNTYGTDALGANVEHIYFGVPDYVQIFSQWGDECLRKLFSYFADERNYPIYLHCTYGMDRTGTVCYLLEALLGMEEEDLMREYDLSALCYGQASKDQMAEFVAALNTKNGFTLQDKVEGHLLSIGVTEEEIANIRRIFLEQP